MGKIRSTFVNLTAWGLVLFVFILLSNSMARAYPVRFTDDGGRAVEMTQKPQRVVSLVPSVTEMIFGLNAGDMVAGVTYHDSDMPTAAGKPIVGGFYHPSIAMIQALSPDLIVVSDKHARLLPELTDTGAQVIRLDMKSIAHSLETMRLLGRIFQRETEAQELVKTIQAELDLIAEKTAGIPQSERLRVIRIMGREKLMTPGLDSFQNEMIRDAGGIPPTFQDAGAVAAVSPEQWKAFNPQVIYGCEGDKVLEKRLFKQPGWRDVSAVKEGRIYYFPCDLTCRASTHTGEFVSWLASRIYREAFSDENHLVYPEKVIARRPIALDLAYVRKAQVVESRIMDFIGKTLVIDFARPQTVLSTLEGWREGIQTVGNHYLPPQTWGLGHRTGLDALQDKVYGVLGKEKATTSFLFTGADMDHLSVQKESHKDMTVQVLVTAGVRSNALRMSKDVGRYYEPGTINMLILTNMTLSPRAMTRLMVTATEAKTAALQDLDIRSSETPLINGATGTGTDNILVVQGEGTAIDNAGGHTKMGELIARAVHRGVTQAVRGQNGLVLERPIFSRLKERGVSLFDLVARANCECAAGDDDFIGELEELLLDPEYAGFLAASLAVSDAHEQGLVKDLSAHVAWCRQIAGEISGRDVEGNLKDLLGKEGIPEVLRMSLNALFNGVQLRQSAD